MIQHIDSTANLKTYKKEKKLFNPAIHSLYLSNPLTKNVIRLLVGVPFSLGSICKY